MRLWSSGVGWRRRVPSPVADQHTGESNPRRRAILELARPYARGVVVDVGCDHGHVAAALGAVGTERRSNRLPRRHDIPLVVADGIAPFRHVDLAVIAGMGPEKIFGILLVTRQPHG